MRNMNVPQTFKKFDEQVRFGEKFKNLEDFIENEKSEKILGWTIW